MPVENPVIRTFSFLDEDTCKTVWTFTLSPRPGGVYIEELTVEERDPAEGCIGHPKMLAALVKNRRVDSLNDDDLALALCVRTLSCGQILARCLRAIQREFAK